MGVYYNSHLVFSAAAGPTAASTALDNPGRTTNVWLESAIDPAAGDSIYITVNVRPHAAVAWRTIGAFRTADFEQGYATATYPFYPFVQIQIHTVTSATPTTSAVVTETLSP